MNISIDKIIEVFCKVDDFCKIFIPIWHRQLIIEKKKRRYRKGNMSESEIMTILILFKLSGYSHFKYFYNSEIVNNRLKLFQSPLSYERFVQVAGNFNQPLTIYLNTLSSMSKGIAFIDSTSMKVCDNKRIYQHQTFKNSAERGKTTMGWFYGFKLHLMINHQAEIISYELTKGNTHDTQVVEKMCKNIKGELYADKGYLSQKLKDNLKTKGVNLITKVRKNMKKITLSKWNKSILFKRNIIETVFNKLKNKMQLVHSRHRSIKGFINNTITSLLAYTFDSNKIDTTIYHQDDLQMN